MNCLLQLCSQIVCLLHRAARSFCFLFRTCGTAICTRLLAASCSRCVGNSITLLRILKAMVRLSPITLHWQVRLACCSGTGSTISSAWPMRVRQSGEFSWASAPGGCCSAAPRLLARSTAKQFALLQAGLCACAHIKCHATSAYGCTAE